MQSMHENIDLAAIKEELGKAKKGEKDILIKRICGSFGLSKSQLYRALRNKYGKSKSVKRDKIIPDEIIDEIGKVKIKGKELGLGEREVSTELAIAYLTSKGFEGELSISTVNRRLRERGFRTPDVQVRVEAQYSNQMHQIDFSRSKYFQIEGVQNGDYVLKVSGRTLFYKEDDAKLRTWLVGITDAYSRARLARAYAATGESAILGIEFLNFCYNREDDEHPLIYIPDILKSDNGSFIKSKPVKELLERLEIESELTRPFQKRGIQKQESSWRSIWQRFELPLALKIGDGKKILLSEYNDLLHEHLIKDLSRPHMIRTGSKMHVYKASLSAHPPRMISEDLREAAFRIERRKVGLDLMISYNGEKYQAPAFAIDKTIKLYKNLFTGELVGELTDEFRKPFILKPAKGFVELGDFEHREHQSYKQKLTQEIKADNKEALAAAEKELKAKIAYMPVRVKKQEINTPFKEARTAEDYSFPTEYHAKVYIGSNLEGETFEDYAEVFEPLFAEGNLSRKSIDEVLSAIKNLRAAQAY